MDNNTLKLVLHGAYTVNKEVRRGVWFAMPYYLIGMNNSIFLKVLNSAIKVFIKKTKRFSEFALKILDN